MHKKLRNMKVIIGIWISSVLIIVSLLTVSTILAENKIVYIIYIKEEIGRRIPSYIERSLHDAEAAGADAVILEINTLGGWLGCLCQGKRRHTELQNSNYSFHK